MPINLKDMTRQRSACFVKKKREKALNTLTGVGPAAVGSEVVILVYTARDQSYVGTKGTKTMDKIFKLK